MKIITVIGISLLIVMILVLSAVGLYYFSSPDLKIKVVQNHYIYNHANKKQAPILVYLLSDGGSQARDLVAAWSEKAAAYNLIIASPVPTMVERAEISSAILNLQQTYQPKLTVLVGFSSFGYFACSIALENGRFGNVAIVPMGAHCEKSDVKKFSPSLARTPILSVVGEKDDWARGQLYLAEDFVQQSTRELKERYGITQEIYYVPDRGHQYLVEAIPYILNWVSSK